MHYIAAVLSVNWDQVLCRVLLLACYFTFCTYLFVCGYFSFDIFESNWIKHLFKFFSLRLVVVNMIN